MKLFLVCLFSIFPLSSYADFESNREHAIKEILLLIEKKRIASEKGDNDFLLSVRQEKTYIMDKGRVLIATKGKRKQSDFMRDLYYADFTYELSNLIDPVIDASDNGDIAWAMTMLERRTYDKKTGKLLYPTRIASFLVFRKVDGKWLLESSAETFDEEFNKRHKPNFQHEKKRKKIE